MDYRIEKRDAFKVIAKRARYEGEERYPNKISMPHGKSARKTEPSRSYASM